MAPTHKASDMSARGSQVTFFMPITSEPPTSQERDAERGSRKGRGNGPKVLTFALNKRPRATRASVPKVRTGCITCKKRHVKCDEAKPFCQRCLKWQGFCEGYDVAPLDQPVRRNTETNPCPDAAAQPPEAQIHPIDCLARRRQDRRLFPELGDDMFSDEFEALYFQSYYKFGEIAGGGFFDSDFWARSVPQLSRDHPAIRYASMACGAIGMAAARSLKPMTPAELAAGGPHYGKALSYYGRAIREVRVANWNTHSLRSAIVCCLLFVCFESLHGDRKAALSHMNNGQKMMDELLRKHDKERGDNILGAEDLERDALHVFQRLILQSWSCGVLRARACEPDCTSDDKCCESQAPRNWCCRGGSNTKCIVEKMPNSFDSLEQAHRWWDVTQHYITHNSNIVFRVMHLGLVEELVAECRDRVMEHMETVETKKSGGQPRTLSDSQPFKDCLSRWNAQFEPLLDAARQARVEDPKSYLKAVLLRVQYLTLYTCLYGPLSCDYQTIKQLTPVFKEIVQLSAILLSHQASSRKQSPCRDVFTMDLGPTWALFLAGTRCRNFGVREEAIRLLHDYPRRDGLWDSRMFYALTVRNRTVELANVTEGTPEEQWWRLQYRVAIVDEQGRLVARAVNRNPLTGKWETGEDKTLRRYLFS